MVDDLAMAADKLERLDSQISQGVSVSKTMLSVNRKTTLEADFLDSLLPLLLPLLEEPRLRNPALVLVAGAYSAVKISQPQVASLGPRTQGRRLAGFLELPILDSVQTTQMREIRLVEEAACLVKQTIVNPNSPSPFLVLVEHPQQVDLGLVVLVLGLQTPTTIQVVAVSLEVVRQITPSASHSRIRPRLSFQVLVSQTRLKTMPLQLLGLVRPSSKTKSRLACSAHSKAPILEEDCLVLQTTINHSKTQVGSSVTHRTTTKAPVAPCLAQSLPRQRIPSATKVPTLQTPMGAFLEG